MAEKLISELLDLPDRVRKGDFVLSLSKGVTEPDKTLDQYVVTPQLADCFEEALGFIRSAVEATSSKACYLHGSFGAGKSHFMAVLHLLLSHEPAVRSVPELEKVVAKHGWAESKKFLLVPYHMLNSRSVETALFGGYVEHVTRAHPDAPLPGVYLAEEIFKNAVTHRADLGDEKFFGKLNQTQSAGGWGKLAKGWDGARFEAALTAPPASEDRTRLVGDLVQHVFPAYKGIAGGKDEAYVDLDTGLSVISAHAKALGYDALILFLDELILWLLTHAGDLGFVHREANKLVKLVESRKAERPIPIVSFVARQRDLREIVGDNVPGADKLNFSEMLSHFDGRFDRINLEDRNLPVIAQRRVLRPKNDAARAELEAAFEKAAEVRTEIMEVLLTREADRALFKMVYPFSPALIQSLVAVSSALQRERTALKIMLQLLVNRRDTLRLGDVIPLGDLWDVVAHGDEAFTDVMRVNFENAKRLYQHKLRPILEQQHGVDLEVDVERAKSDPEVADKLIRFQNDDRLVKSLLLSALVHGVEALKNMTCLRLAALNHGTIRSKIPGREHQVVAQKLRSWAGMVGEIRVGDEPTNPSVSIQLSGVDTEGVIEAARVYDNPGNRQYKIRQMLFKSLGVPEKDEMFVTHQFHWRGSKRTCDVLFSNVRSVPDESLRAADDNWKLIVDFPFDAEGHTPTEDLDRLNKFRDRGERPRTIVWLPAFFAPRTQAELGKLVIIDRLLLGTNLEQHAKHLSLQDQQTARLLLQNQQSALSQRLLQAVEAAYAIRNEPTPGTLDASFDMGDSHFQSLYPTLALQRPIGANLGEALTHLLDQALSHQYPKHPKFGQEIKPGKDLKQVLEVCQEAARTPDGRVFVEDKAVRLKLRNVANPLDLGQMSETHFVLGSTWKNHFNKMLAASQQPDPTVALLRQWTDQPEERGLPREVQNLLVLTYADQTNRAFYDHGTKPYPPALDDLPGTLVLKEEALPDSKDWNEAVTRSADLFGHAVSRLLNASNLAALASKVGETVGEYKADCDGLSDRLHLVLQGVGINEADAAKSARVRTAKAVRGLFTACDGKEPTVVVGALARAKLDTSATAMGRSVKSARGVLDCLKATRWDLFTAVAQIEDGRKTAADLLLQDVRSWLTADEHAVAGGVTAKLSEAEGRAIKLLTPPKTASVPPGVPVPPPPVVTPPRPGGPEWKVADSGTETRLTETDWRSAAEELARKLRANPRLRLTVGWTLEEGPA